MDKMPAAMNRQTPQQRTATDRFSQKFWADRLYHRTWEKDGRLVESNSYYVRIKHGASRRSVNLCTADKGDAARRAFYFFKVLMAQGWESAEATLRAPDEKPKAKSCTIGEYINAARGHFEGLRSTFEDYAASFRRIVAESLKVVPEGMEERAFAKAEELALAELRKAQAEGQKGVPPRFHLRDKSKEEKAWLSRRAGNLYEEALSRLRYDYAGKGNEAWAQAVDRLPLSKVTPAVVNRWKNARVNAAGEGNTQARNRATISVASVMRQARSLFSEKKILKFVRSEIPNLPEVLPFHEVTIDRAKIKRFSVQVGWDELWPAALSELASEPEVMKGFCLAAWGGLRRREMDALTWDNLDTKRGVLKVAVNEHYAGKTDDSRREIPLPQEITDYLSQRKNFEKAKDGDFLIKGNHSVSQRTRGYRCKKVWSRLIAWLREQGLNDPRPIHYLRKLVGDTLANQKGIYATSNFLRHSSVQVTQAYYVSGKATDAPDITAAMGGKVIAFPTQEPQETKGKRRATK
jgi:integrase